MGEKFEWSEKKQIALYLLFVSGIIRNHTTSRGPDVIPHPEAIFKNCWARKLLIWVDNNKWSSPHSRINQTQIILV